MSYELLTKSEAAKRARISRHKLDHAVKAGTGPVLTCIGARRLVRADKLDEWLDRCTQEVPHPVPPGVVVAPRQAAA